MATPASILQQYPQLANDPQFMQGYQQLMAMQGGPDWRYRSGSPEVQNLIASLTQRGKQIGAIPQDREISAQGNDISVHAVRNAAIKAGVFAGTAVAGGALLNGALSGGAAGSGGIASTSSPIASTVAPGAGSAATVAGTGSTVAPLARAASSVPYGKIIDAGVNLAGTYLQNRAQGKAIDAQTQANQQAQADLKATQQQQIGRIDRNLDTQRQLFAPYVTLGAGASSTLASRLGLPTGPAPGTQPLPASNPNTQLTPIDPGNAQGIVTNPQGPPLSSPQAGTLASLGVAAKQQQAQNQTTSGYVTMLDPKTGETGQVEPHQVQFYKDKGAQVVQ